MQISVGVIHLGLWPRSITPSSICIILHILLSFIPYLLGKAISIKKHIFKKIRLGINFKAKKENN